MGRRGRRTFRCSCHKEMDLWDRRIQRPCRRHGGRTPEPGWLGTPKDDDAAARQYDATVLSGRLRQTVRSITNRDGGGVLQLHQDRQACAGDALGQTPRHPRPRPHCFEPRHLRAIEIHARRRCPWEPEVVHVTLMVSATNGFNNSGRKAMIWTVCHSWDVGARFTFNCYRHSLPCSFCIAEGNPAIGSSPMRG